MFSKEVLPVPVHSSPPPSTKYRIRRRRSLIAFVVIFVIGIVFFTPREFWDISKGLGRASELGGSTSGSLYKVNDKEKQKQADKDKEMSDNANNADSTSASAELSPTEELKLLLHMVASTELRIPKDADPSKPLPRDVYDAGIGGGFGGGIAWLQAQQADPPVIVFSKTTCPYSTKAKETLKSFNLSPPEKVVEVDKRDDADALKIILTRLTEHSTFPNIFIKGQSIGGNDDLQELIAKDQLLALFADAGVSVVQENN